MFKKTQSQTQAKSCLPLLGGDVPPPPTKSPASTPGGRFIPYMYYVKGSAEYTFSTAYKDAYYV